MIFCNYSMYIWNESSCLLCLECFRADNSSNWQTLWPGSRTSGTNFPVVLTCHRTKCGRNVNIIVKATWERHGLICWHSTALTTAWRPEAQWINIQHTEESCLLICEKNFMTLVYHTQTGQAHLVKHQQKSSCDNRPRNFNFGDILGSGGTLSSKDQSLWL